MGQALPAGARGLLLFQGSCAFDPLGSYFKLFFILASAIVIVLTMRSRDFGERKMGEFYGLLVAVVAGMFLMSISTNMLMLYLSLELVSYVSYVLVGYVKEDKRATRGGAEVRPLRLRLLRRDGLRPLDPLRPDRAN